MRKIGYDYVFMFMALVGIDLIKIEFLHNTLVILALGIYLYDMFKLNEDSQRCCYVII
ncbi:MAG: hypothetical protein IJ767_00195 [Bacteroidaceae bacterium]|nr:hypothetical protein [Bacteroidaceae bacterium]